MAKIQVFTVLGKNGKMFANFLHTTMTRLSSGEHDLEFNCFMSSETNPPKHWIALEYILKQKHTSLNHTVGLNRIQDYVNGDFVIVTDADIALLVPNWDTFFIDSMNKVNIDIFGIDHWRQIHTHPVGYLKFPIVTFFVAKSHSYLRAQVDYRPNLDGYQNRLGIGSQHYKISTPEDQYIFGRKIGTTIRLDSGWQMPYAYKKANLQGKTLLQGHEYDINLVPQIWMINGQMGICHKGKSSKRRKGTAMNFFNTVSEYVNRVHGIKLIKK